MFFKKKDKPKLIAECDNWAVRKYAPIRPAREFDPPGWKGMDIFVKREEHLIDSVKTVKACPGISDYIGMGYIIPAWCDMEIQPTEDNFTATVRYSDPRYNHGWHHPNQLQNFMSEKFDVKSAIKLDNPWRIWTDNGYSLLYLPLFYWPDRNWEAVPGVIDTDLGALISPINIMIKRPIKTLIRQGEPLVQIIPFKREDFLAESRAVTSAAAERHNAVCALHSMSFKGWIRYMKERKPFKMIYKDTELPG